MKKSNYVREKPCGRAFGSFAREKPCNSLGFRVKGSNQAVKIRPRCASLERLPTRPQNPHYTNFNNHTTCDTSLVDIKQTSRSAQSLLRGQRLRTPLRLLDIRQI